MTSVTASGRTLLPKSLSLSSSIVKTGLKIVCISDTHECEDKLPPIPFGDVLIHTGDFTNTGREAKIMKFTKWMSDQPHAIKILIAGNHDMTLDADSYEKIVRQSNKRKGSIPPGAGKTTAEVSFDKVTVNNISAENRSLVMNHPSITYLEDTSTTIKTLNNDINDYNSNDNDNTNKIAKKSNIDSEKDTKNNDENSSSDINIYGTPWQPEFWGGFNLPMDSKEIKEKWEAIPFNTDILLTHGPPNGVLDMVKGNNVGCKELIKEIRKRNHIRLNIFGHIHENHGSVYDDSLNCLFVNATSCNTELQPDNKPIVVFLPFDKTQKAFVM